MSSNPLDDLISIDDAPTASQVRNDKAARAQAIDADLDLSIEGLDLENTITEPLAVTYHPVTGEPVDLSSVDAVVRHIIEVKVMVANVEKFEADLRRAALHLSAGETKTRRISAVVDSQLRTLVVEVPDDIWPNRDLAVFYTWCEKNKTALGGFAERFVRKVPKVEYSPIKKEVKKLLNETLPEGTILAEAKDKLLACNKGNVGKLPKVTIEGEKLNPRDQQNYGDGDE